MKKQNTSKKDLIIYQAKSGAIELKGDFSKETIWATQSQIGSAFNVDVRTVNEHIKNIYKSAELKEKATLRNFRIVQKEGKREIERSVQHYNLDMILSVGYRVNSKKATQFRQWATKTLRAHIVEGYTINKSRIAKNYDTFLEAVERVKILLPSNGVIDSEDTLELIKLFAGTWFSLDAYDKSSLPKGGATKRQVIFVASDINKAIAKLRTELIKKGEASEHFATEREKDAVAGIVGNIFQAFGGNDLYESVEEKAAHLLYFIIKNHPFTDGNKRSGAFAFVWFLKKAKILDTKRMTPEALTALALLVAESDPKEKERVVGLVLMLLKK